MSPEQLAPENPLAEKANAEFEALRAQQVAEELLSEMALQRSSDPVNNPKHYNSHPSGVECITVAEHMGFNLGNVLKYIWRADHKGVPLQDLEKAAWYLNREIERRKKST